jgi:pentose-5-phosphate-3-epimerase
MLDEIHSTAWLEVDGGISTETLPLMLRAGATAFVAGVSVFRHPQGVAGGIRALQNTIME